jgi:predicted transcriptional regulator
LKLFTEKGFPYQAVTRKAVALGLYAPFTMGDEELIDKFYKSDRAKLFKLLADRHSYTSVQLHWRKMFLAGRSRHTRRKAHWSREEDATLRRMVQELYGYRAIRTALNRRTHKQIRARIRKLGLTSERPQGMATITEIANKAGFSWKMVKRELEAAGVIIHVTNRMTTERGRKRTHMLVDECDAMEAMEAFVAKLNRCVGWKDLAQEFKTSIQTLQTACRIYKVAFPAAPAPGVKVQFEPEKADEIREAMRKHRANPIPDGPKTSKARKAWEASV